MVVEVEHTLAAFLEAWPEQVRMWDARVIAGMVQHPQTFEAFKAGNDTMKWRIYIALRMNPSGAMAA